MLVGNDGVRRCRLSQKYFLFTSLWDEVCFVNRYAMERVVAVFVAPNGSRGGKEHYDPNEIEHRDEQVEHLPARLVEVVLPADGPINIKSHTGHAVDA